MTEAKKKKHAKHILNQIGIKSSDSNFDFLQKEVMYYLDIGKSDSAIKRKVKQELEREEAS